MSNCYSQKENSRLETIEQARIDLNDLLVEGKLIVDVMDDIRQSPRQQELTMKFQKGIQNNYDWFVENLQNLTPGQPMQYHPNLGLTKEEYDELQVLIKDVEIASSGKVNVEIIKGDSIISFNTNEKLEILNTIKINLIQNQIKIGEITLSYDGPVNVDNDQNGFKSRWKGHNWIYEFPENLSTEMLRDVQTLVAKHYKFTVGRLEKNGKTFLQIKGLEFNNGVKEAEFDIPLMF